MPNPKDYKSQKEFLAACIPMVIKDKSAKDNEQATAICYSMWRNRKKMMTKANALDATLPDSLQIASLDLDCGPFAQSDLAKSKSSSDGSVDDNHGRRLAGAVGDAKSTKSSEQEQQRGDKAMADQTELRKEVELILAARDAAKQVEDRIAGLEAEKGQLVSAQSQIATEKAKLSEQLTSAQADVAKHAEQVKTLATEKAELEATVSRLNGELTKIREEQALATRTVELTAAGLLLPEGEKRDKQLLKVRAMDDNTYAVYKQELTELAETVKAAAGQKPDAAKAAADKAAADKAAADKAAADKAEADKATAAAGEVQPPDLSHGEIYRQAVAAVSAGIQVDETMVGTYAKM